MKKISLASLPVNQQLARDLYDINGKLLLAHGVVLKPQHIEQLLQKGYEEIFVADSEDIAADAPQVPSSQPQKILPQSISHSIESMRTWMRRVSNGHRVKKDEVEETIDMIVPEIVETNNILGNLRLLREKDEYTLKHSVSVCVVATKLAQTMKLPPPALRSLGLAALLHDIGKCKVPVEIINKPGKLTEEEFREIQKHPVYGYQIVKDLQLRDTQILTAILQHHEHQNGKGYPLRLGSDNLHIYSRIIAVADVFDALTSNRAYRQALPMFEALDQIIQESAGHLDPIVSKQLFTYVLNVIPGETVKLNDGQEAVVVMVNRDELNRPLVRTSNGEFINLKEKRDLYVVDILS